MADLAGQNVVLGAYFTGKVHPQHGKAVQNENFEYLAGWFHSLMRLGLETVVLHDGLSRTFTDKYENLYQRLAKKNARARFIKVEIGSFTAADERFLALRDFLEEHAVANAFMVDVSDAWFGRDPFPLLTRRRRRDYFDTEALKRCPGIGQLHAFWREQLRIWSKRRAYRFFMGGEPKSIGDNPWMLKHFRKVYGQEFPDLADKPVLNCGILGGSRQDLLELLGKFRDELNRLRVTEILNDMAMFNRILHQEYPPDVVYSGGVLNSPWKRYLKQGNYRIFHK